MTLSMMSSLEISDSIRSIRLCELENTHTNVMSFNISYKWKIFF
jgi:uracil-DNA glycosylase